MLIYEPPPANPTKHGLYTGGEKGGARAADLEFSGTVVWAVDDCGLLADEDDSQARAQHILRLQERARVEEHTAPQLITRAGTPATATGLPAALGKAEEQIAQYGYPGVVHAAAHLAAAAESQHLILRNGPNLTTPLGNRWAFGAGYDTLAETLYATGPVVVHRGPVVTTAGPNHRTNERLIVAEREVLVAWECFTLATTIV